MAVVTIVGAGVIGLSWARLFGAAGWEVRLSDPRPDLPEIVLRDLSGLRVTATDDLAAAASGADFVQEAGPERMPVKETVFATLAEHTRDDVVLASSSSSLLPSLIAAGNPAADRIVVGHPFNPPELMPLVEVVPGPDTSARTVERAMEVYRGLGKLPIRLKKEIPGYVGNRLQKVFNDQAIHLVQEGVIDVADLDDLVRASLGLRWATVGPFESGMLGGGPEGMRHLVTHVGSQTPSRRERRTRPGWARCWTRWRRRTAPVWPPTTGWPSCATNGRGRCWSRWAGRCRLRCGTAELRCPSQKFHWNETCGRGQRPPVSQGGRCGGGAGSHRRQGGAVVVEAVG
ncbi:3-hydroxyacyl-CoA dehydrogenase NAD-binding domain-containing protein, partial [Streptomyces bauhiniae]|uniref:3-hydroxyacyl-CoA dehydrogenase NAD-binding domain-containing protein n=1 Tax=Streptomyces bauhiniae TaxID=2340725 RepID=UPI003648E326